MSTWCKSHALLPVQLASVSVAQGPDKLKEALEQLQRYTTGGLPATHYGVVPGLPALATAALGVTLCFVTQAGKVSRLPV